MSERYSSSQIPLPPQFRATGFSERKLQPLSERKSELPVYGNLMGKKFTVECVNKEENELYRDIHIRIDEVAPDRRGYLVVAKLLVSQDSIYISSIDSHTCDCRDFVLSLYFEPPSEWKGFDFMGIIMEHVKNIARERTIGVIEIRPADRALARYYKSHGFMEDPADPDAKMVYRMPNEASA